MKTLLKKKTISSVRVQLVRDREVTLPTEQISCIDHVADLFYEFLGEPDREHFVVICFDVKKRPIHLELVHIGTLTTAQIHPREILKSAILANAHSMIVCHNHPSGNLTASSPDIDFTKRMKEACDLIGIGLLDHVIVGGGRQSSIRDQRHIPFW